MIRHLAASNIRPRDTYFRSGEYAIVSCARDNSLLVGRMLEHLRPALLQAIQDVESPTMSPAYRAFFKDAENTAYVSNILANITNGTPIHPPTSVNDGGPIIVCVNSPDVIAGTYPWGERYEAFNDCKNNPTWSSQSVSGTPYVVLCPFFWTSGFGTQRTFPPENECLSVDTRRNRFRADYTGLAGLTMTHYAMWVLLEQIVHIYLIPEQLRRGVAPGDKSDDANELFALSPDKALMSANVYVYYVASVYGHCTTFPTPKV
ncbi:MAG: hypothetical protein LQ352_005868 [Teloschistes flavicans]|nr:MAG: hypothetical protein LQ352_005868 [Teloschistes flavicans]